MMMRDTHPAHSNRCCWLGYTSLVRWWVGASLEMGTSANYRRDVRGSRCCQVGGYGMGGCGKTCFFVTYEYESMSNLSEQV